MYTILQVNPPCCEWPQMYLDDLRDSEVFFHSRMFLLMNPLWFLGPPGSTCIWMIRNTFGVNHHEHHDLPSNITLQGTNYILLKVCWEDEKSISFIGGIS